MAVGRIQDGVSIGWEISMKSLQKEAWRWLVPLGITAFMVIILRFVFLFGYVPTESMEPTLE